MPRLLEPFIHFISQGLHTPAPHLTAPYRTALHHTAPYRTTPAPHRAVPHQVPIFHFYGDLHGSARRFSDSMLGPAMERRNERFPWAARLPQARPAQQHAPPPPHLRSACVPHLPPSRTRPAPALHPLGIRCASVR